FGTENVLDEAIRHGVKKVICLSTDKAAYPINAMGMSKAMMEKVAIAKSRVSSKTDIICTRYGNVMASRGSVIPLFIDQIKGGATLTVTNPTMTRFMMSLEDAVELVLDAFEHGNSGDLFVQKAPAATIETLGKSLLELFESDTPVGVIGTRHGEKLYETLLTVEEMHKAQDLGDYFKVSPDDRDLNYDKYFEEGQPKLMNGDEYNSHNTERLSIEEMKDLLLKLDYVQGQLENQKTNLA